MKSGQLSKEDMTLEQESGGLTIVPFDMSRQKGASYDISPTIIAMSTKVGMLETVYRERNYPYKYYVNVKAKDTVLAVSREYISVPPNMAGYVVSRVSKVSEGFGHVSTSIDPNWKGALLIALSNPSNKPIKVCVGGGSEENGKSLSLATTSFHYLNTPCDEAEIEYSGMRLDLLKSLAYLKRQGIKAWINKNIHPNRRKFTDFFFNYCEMQTIDEKNWPTIANELQGILPHQECIYCKNYTDANKKKKQYLADFIITEHFLLRTVHILQKYWGSIWKTVAVVFATLVVLGVMPNAWQNITKRFFEAFNLLK